MLALVKGIVATATVTTVEQVAAEPIGTLAAGEEKPVTVTFAEELPDADYSMVLTVEETEPGAPPLRVAEVVAKTPAAVTLQVVNEAPDARGGVLNVVAQARRLT